MNNRLTDNNFSEKLSERHDACSTEPTRIKKKISIQESVFDEAAGRAKILVKVFEWR